MYLDRVIEVRQTDRFAEWLSSLRDRAAVQRITARIVRMQSGNIGETRSLGGGLHEAKIVYGPGYRLYFVNRGSEIIVLLCGGDKGSQRRDIRIAAELAQEA